MAKPDPRVNGGGGGYFPAIYDSALAQTAQDYDSIMGQYKGLTDSASSDASSSPKLNFSAISPATADYQPGSNYDYLRDFTKTGGYSDSDVSNLRERAIAPIRSIYSSAQKNLARQKSLQGGYSPNFGAASAKMARESGYLIGDQATNANAAIAEMVQRGKLAGAQALAPLESHETDLRNSINQNNANTTNDFMKFNAQMPLAYAESNRADSSNDFSKILEGIKGQQSLYGTTPGLQSTIGGQTMQAANIASNFPSVPSGALSTGGGLPSSGGYQPNMFGDRLPTYRAGVNYG